jgi:anti-sigma28 factor (negative regulator of flagellin synthesis)
MHLLKYNPDAKTLTEVPPSEFDADPTCRYFYVLGNRAHVPIVTPDGIGEIVWQHPDYQPPSPANTMTDQHRATPEQWEELQTVSQSILKMHAPHSCILELRDRVEALEATQHAHIKAGAAGVEATEAGVRYAIEQLRSKPGRWQPLKVETTYGSDASIPELSQSDVKAAEMEWARTAPGMRSDATDRVLALDAVAAAGAQVGRSSAAVDRVLALQDQIRDGTLTLADALKEIGASEPAPCPRPSSLVDRVADAIGAADDEGLTNMTWSNHSRDAIREVAAWINERELKAQNDPYCLAAPTADEVLGWLRNEADR